MFSSRPLKYANLTLFTQNRQNYGVLAILSAIELMVSTLETCQFKIKEQKHTKTVNLVEAAYLKIEQSLFKYIFHFYPRCQLREVTCMHSCLQLPYINIDADFKNIIFFCNFCYFIQQPQSMGCLVYSQNMQNILSSICYDDLEASFISFSIMQF